MRQSQARAKALLESHGKSEQDMHDDPHDIDTKEGNSCPSWDASRLDEGHDSQSQQAEERHIQSGEQPILKAYLPEEQGKCAAQRQIDGIAAQDLLNARTGAFSPGQLISDYGIGK